MKHVELPEPPPAAVELFGDRLGRAARYAALLATDGVERGLIGPREADRIWQRHLLNSAAVESLVPDGATVIDVGSGAGLPGIPLALARPDVHVILLEPMLRRTTFLQEAVYAVGVDARVVRGRAEDAAIRDQLAGADVVVCRAVAGLDKVAEWGLPLLRRGGLLLALKGDRADEEVAQNRRVMSELGAEAVRVVRCGGDYFDPPATVVIARRGSAMLPKSLPGRARSGRRS
ncbi:MAG: 16S rRNA (guanine(527)-N(7))-methyltransferase RsmG [Candidatus Sericytochromatia bacterium]